MKLRRITLNLLTLATLVLAGLKLCGVLKYSWLTVLSPLWLPAVLGVGCLILAALMEAMTRTAARIEINQTRAEVARRRNVNNQFSRSRR